MHVQMVTLMVTIDSTVDQSHIYESDLWSFIAETPECCPCYLLVGIRLFQDSPGRFKDYWVSAQRLFGDDDDVSFSSVYFGPLSWICGYIFLQMVVINSGAVTQCNRCSDDSEDGTVHCIHASASSTFCIHRHLTHVYPYSGYILD